MFDTMVTSPLEDATAPRAALQAATVTAWQQSLSAATSTASGLDDAERIDAIRALEELVCTATAAQAMLSAELDGSQRVEHAAAGEPPARQGRGVAAQVALARRESHHRGQRHLGLARIVAAELPHTWAAWRAGCITEWTATLIARETACLSRVDRGAVDVGVAGDPDQLERMSPRQVMHACQAEAARLDPASIVARRRKAETERRVSLRPAPDTMTWLTALLPVKDGVAVHAALVRAAETAVAARDGRSRGQTMADTLVASVLAGDAARAHDLTRWDPAPTEDQAAAAAGVTLNLVMTDLSLFGTSEAPGHLDGYGPVPAELARELVAGACARGERVWLRRLYTSPVTGELVSMDARSRLFRGSLARYIRLRDQTCRTPWCDAPVRAVDHAEDHDVGGDTSAVNGQGLCEACNHAKQAPGWQARPSPGVGGHEIETTTPTGHTYRTRPPAVATIRESPIRIDYVLTG
jgi:hypothetical protein